MAGRLSAQEYTVTITLHFVTKEDRRQIAEVAWAAIKDAVRFYGPDVRGGELIEITSHEPSPGTRLPRV